MHPDVRAGARELKVSHILRLRFSQGFHPLGLCFLLHNPRETWDLGPSGWQWPRDVCEHRGVGAREGQGLGEGVERRWAGVHSPPSSAKSCRPSEMTVEMTVDASPGG